MNIPINRDTIATFAITELHIATDLRSSIDACDSLAEFLDIAMTELRDADDLHNTLNPLDDDTRADAILDTLSNPSDYAFIYTAMGDYINESNI